MNLIRLVADMLHLAAICILIYRLHKTRNCIGISCKTQELFLITFCVRYFDLFLYYISLYNTCMKIFFICSSMYIIYLMRYKRPYCITYDKVADEFPHFLVILPAALGLTCLVNSGWEPWEFMWSYSLWLESLAFVP